MQIFSLLSRTKESQLRSKREPAPKKFNYDHPKYDFLKYQDAHDFTARFMKYLDADVTKKVIEFTSQFKNSRESMEGFLSGIGSSVMFESVSKKFAAAIEEKAKNIPMPPPPPGTR